jgi:TM2 domain-containing membrane protein YozV
MRKVIKLSFLAIALVVATVNSTNAAFPKEKQTASEVVVNTNTVVANTDESVNSKAELKKELTNLSKTEAHWYAGSGKSKILAAVLAFFLGAFGIHSFYMGNKKKGLIQLGLGVGGIILTIVGLAKAVTAVASTTATTTPTVAIPTLAIIGYIMLVGVSIWAFIDFIRILTGGLAPEEGFDS